jgi:hypothetical protein
MFPTGCIEFGIEVQHRSDKRFSKDDILKYFYQILVKYLELLLPSAFEEYSQLRILINVLPARGKARKPGIHAFPLIASLIFRKRQTHVFSIRQKN